MLSVLTAFTFGLALGLDFHLRIPKICGLPGDFDPFTEMFPKVVFSNQNVLNRAAGASASQHVLTARRTFNATRCRDVFPVLYFDGRFTAGLRALRPHSDREHCRDAECCTDEFHSALRNPDEHDATIVPLRLQP